MKLSLIILNQNDVLAINPVDRKDANGKKCPGKADQYLQRIPILDFLGHLNLKVVLIIFWHIVVYFVVKKSTLRNFAFTSKSELMSVLCSPFSGLCIFEGRGVMMRKILQQRLPVIHSPI